MTACIANQRIKYIKVQWTPSLEHLRHRNQAEVKIWAAIFLITCKHADARAAGRGFYVHAMAMTKTTREGDVKPGQSSMVRPRQNETERENQGIVVP
jgi:hypothetical protein